MYVCNKEEEGESCRHRRTLVVRTKKSCKMIVQLGNYKMKRVEDKRSKGKKKKQKNARKSNQITKIQ